MRINTVLKALLGAAAAAALLHGPAAQAQATADPTKPAPTQGAAAGQGGAAPSAAAPAKAMSKADQNIVMSMAQGNMAEIELAKLAQGKSQNEQVKTFAQQMIDDHTKALAEVQQLATTKGLTLPTELDPKHKARIDKLSGQSGEAFDKAYMAQAGVADHKKMHSMLVSAQKKAKDPDVKALAARVTPTVDQHLKAAQQLKPGAASATGSSASGASGAGGGKVDKPPGAATPGQ